MYNKGQYETIDFTNEYCLLNLKTLQGIKVETVVVRRKLKRITGHQTTVSRVCLMNVNVTFPKSPCVDKFTVMGAVIVVR